MSDDAGNAIGGWRYQLGVVLLVVSLILPLIAAVIVPFLGLPAGVNGVVMALSLVGGPDLLLLLAGATMGKENIDRIVGTIAPWFKRLVRWNDVSRERYRLGLAVLAAAFLVPIVIALFFDESVVNDDLEPGWGYYAIMASYLAFAAGFFIAGAPLWDRLRAVFTWDATITFPPTEDNDA